MKASLMWDGDETHAPISLSPEEREAFVAADPVMAFYERAQDRAINHPEWRENYLRATYLSFVEEYNAYVIEKLKEHAHLKSA